MAKEITTHIWCDPCMDEDVQTPGTTTAPLNLTGKGEGLTMDLCEQHRKALLGPLADALAAWGAKPHDGGARAPKVRTRAPARQPAPGEEPKLGAAATTRKVRRTILGPFECKVPGCKSARPSINLDAFAQHLSRHDTTLNAYREEYGPPGPGRPDIPEQADLLAGIYRCTECGEVFSQELGYTMPAQALGRHALNAHGVPGANRQSA